MGLNKSDVNREVTILLALKVLFFSLSKIIWDCASVKYLLLNKKNELFVCIGEIAKME